jgi:cellulose biosynthesis operon protein BcsF/YhjT
MDLLDILEVALISGIIFFILGYKTRSWVGKGYIRAPRLFLSPHYLKPEGYLVSTNTKEKKE